MADKAVNLDSLRAPSRIVTFLGRDYETGYIPSGASIPLLVSYQAMADKQAAGAGGRGYEESLRYAAEHTEEVVPDEIRVVAKYCSFFYPDVTEETVAREASREMVDAFFRELILSIVRNSAAGAKEGAEGSDAAGEKKSTTGQSPSTSSA
jgi:hypothetical protein